MNYFIDCLKYYLWHQYNKFKTEIKKKVPELLTHRVALSLIFGLGLISLFRDNKIAPLGLFLIYLLYYNYLEIKNGEWKGFMYEKIKEKYRKKGG